MPVEYVWTLAAALFVAALGATLKAADAISSLKLAEKEIDRLRKEIDSLKQKENDGMPASEKLEPQGVNLNGPMSALPANHPIRKRRGW